MNTIDVPRTAIATMLAAIGVAFAGGCSGSDPGAAVCPVPLELAPMLVYPRSGATVTPANSGIILYGNTGPATVPIAIVGAHANVDTIPTALPSPLPSPTATPPFPQQSWGTIHAVEIRPLLPAGAYDVEATVTRYSCSGGTPQQRNIGSFKLIGATPKERNQ
jgi:hypothetical protein